MTKILSRPGFRRLLGATLSLLLIAAFPAGLRRERFGHFRSGFRSR